jgi:hypothetical protein
VFRLRRSVDPSLSLLPSGSQQLCVPFRVCVGDRFRFAMKPRPSDVAILEQPQIDAVRQVHRHADQLA